MDQRAVGISGLRVSELGLGTMTWGRDTDAVDAEAMLSDFLDAGGTFVDTAPGYGDGAAEEIIGSAIAGGVPRGELVIATKAGVRGLGGRATVDASRATLLDSLDASLRRLGTDHVDLFLVQAPDPATPLAETAHALRLAVETGRTRYVGVSNFPGWLCAQTAGILGDIGLTAVEHEYSLLQRGVEREVLPAGSAIGFGLLAWSPLGRGILTGRYRNSTPADSRGASPHLRPFVEPLLTERSFGIVEAVARAAHGLETQPFEVALAWIRHRPGLASAIVGPRTPAQLRALLASELEIPSVILTALDDVSRPCIGYPERPREQDG
ncbi:MAG TPA: aldo/keto reductase [Actinomycetaceae bacterium]|nr:aldo/keto reductase [Actinomycetaceae bacterium]